MSHKEKRKCVSCGARIEISSGPCPTCGFNRERGENKVSANFMGVSEAEMAARRREDRNSRRRAA